MRQKFERFEPLHNDRFADCPRCRQIIYYDVIPKLPLGNAVQVNSLELLLTESDFVSLHVPNLPSTVGLIGATEIGQMKKGAYLLNASRGRVVDLDALAVALKSGVPSVPSCLPVRPWRCMVPVFFFFCNQRPWYGPHHCLRRVLPWVVTDCVGECISHFPPFLRLFQFFQK